MNEIIIGTAGHIDHGKTALVKALTGVDADRFPEEKERGITIDIGFAELDLDGLRIGFVDVPGHEKFVKNMLAGAHGIDLVALVVAADEGVMPQTREHFEICRLLETKTGLIVLTKTDLVDDELLEIAELDVSELVENSFLQNAPVVAVSSKTGEGIENLKTTLRSLAEKIPAREEEMIARLPIDRSFSVKGFGAVVTGTLVSGEFSVGDELEILTAGKRVRVRGIQVYGKPVETAHAGQRTAVNLAGIDHTEISRGMLLTVPGVLRPTQIIDAEIEVLRNSLRPLRSRQRVRVHMGTIEALARVQVLNERDEIEQGRKDFVQLRLEVPVAAVPAERLILRSYSPQATIAGGRILDAQTGKHRRKDLQPVRSFLNDLIGAGRERGQRVKIYLEAGGGRGASFSDLQARTGWLGPVLTQALEENLKNGAVVEAAGVYIAATPFNDLKEKTLAEILKFHRREPLARGILRETLREKIFSHFPAEIFRAVLRALENEKAIVAEKDIVRDASHALELSADEILLRDRLTEIYRNAGLEAPKLDEALSDALKGTRSDQAHARKVFQLLLNAGELVKVTEEYYFRRSAVEALVSEIRAFANKTDDRLIDVAQFKNIAGISRKYAIPLLEYFDIEKITRRAGDKRLVF